MKKIIILLALLTITSYAYATTINIPTDYSTIQAGIDAAVDYDTVLVDTGTYVENINFNGKNITVASLFLTTQDTSYISQTSIDGDSSGSVVTFESGEDSTAVLSGFTITNGSEFYGGGIYCYWPSSPSLENITISNNTANRGGGVYCDIDSNPIFYNVTISNNISEWDGGGIYCLQSDPILENVTITNNSANFNGGGIYCWFANINLTNISIMNNIADSIGGGIYYGHSISNFDNVTISNNFASDLGGGIYCLESDPVFSSENRCNIYLNDILNSKGYGADIYYQNYGDTFNVILDTFTVIAPTDYYASPTKRLNFDILHGIKNNLINSDIYVSVDGDNSNSGTNPDVPLKTIKYALSRLYSDSLNQNTIHLESGTYSPSTNGEEFPLEWSNYVSLEGSSESETILDADSTNKVMKFDYITDATIKNISIINGYAQINGGGIYCLQSDPILENVTITNNSANFNGGGIYCNESNPSLENISISNNTAGWGGGIYWNYYSPTLENVTISNNTADYKGGGIYSRNGSSANLLRATISNNTADNRGGGIYCLNSIINLVDITINNNTAASLGGGIYCSSSSPSLENVTISNNTAGNAGGGILFANNSNPSLKNVIITNNISNSHGGGIACVSSNPSLKNTIVSYNFGNYGIYVDSGNPTIEYSDFYNNENGNFYGCDQYIGQNVTTNANGDSCDVYFNIQRDPCFVDTANGDFHLTENSPCVDAGTPDTTGLNLPQWDLDGNIRIWDGNDDGTAIIDMGPYEYDAPVYAIDDEPQDIAKQNFINYPNPITAKSNEINIKFSLKKPSKVNIKLYNIKGQLVTEILNDNKPSGTHTTSSNINNLASGIYFIKMDVDGKNREVKKMVKIE